MLYAYSVFTTCVSHIERLFGRFRISGTQFECDENGKVFEAKKTYFGNVGDIWTLACK